MKTKTPANPVLLRFLCLLPCAFCLCAWAQGTAFTYQGRLTDGANPANGSYDLKLTLCDAATLGGVVAGPITNSPVVVSNGVLTVTLDFGAAAFNGSARWLDIGVRTNGGVAFTPLTPRQALTPTPYALTASNLSGTLPAAQLSGTVADGRLSANVTLLGATIESAEITDGTIVNADLSASAAIADTKLGTITTAGKVANSATTAASANTANAIVARDASGNFTAGTVTATFSGNGAALTTLNASQLTTGAVPDGRLSANVTLLGQTIGSAEITDGTIVNADLSASAAITDTKLGTITTAGKVANSATTAASANTANAIVARDASGNFTAGTVTATFSGNGASLTSLNASQLTSGTVADARLSANVTLLGQTIGSAEITDGTIVNADLSASAAIADTKLATITTAGKVANSATTAASANTANAIVARDASGTFSAGTVSATFSGNGASLTSLNASQLTSGTVADARLSANVSLLGQSIGSAEIADGSIAAADLSTALLSTTFWRAGGNTGTTAGTHYMGTADDEPLEFKVNGLRAFRLEPNANSPNMVGGFSGNFLGAGYYGSTIGGGGSLSYSNSILANYATIAGGRQNNIDTGSDQGAIGGGLANDVGTNSPYSTISGGNANIIAGLSTAGTIAGGRLNDIGLNSDYGAIGGGYNNNISSNSTYVVMGGGYGNAIAASSSYVLIAGGRVNDIGPDSIYCAIGGGASNSIADASESVALAGGAMNGVGTNSFCCVISGGYGNTLGANLSQATIAGGDRNTVLSGSATIAGGYMNYIGLNSVGAIVAGGGWNRIDSITGFIGGGYTNTIAADSEHATIAGGQVNSIGSSARLSAIGGGNHNTIRSGAGLATIAGGSYNEILTGGEYGMIAGGYDNAAAYSAFAAGTCAKANHDGAFVWADNTVADFASDRVNQFKIRAGGGMHLVAKSTGLNPAAMKVESTSAAGVGLVISQTSSDANLVMANPGTGPQIKAFNGPGGGTLVFQVDNDGDVTCKSLVQTSDRAAKENFTAIDSRAVLDKVAALAISRWNFKQDDTRHIGPMAQDFHAAFGVGPDDKHIAAVDADGVALAAIQGLNQKLEAEVKSKSAEIAELRCELQALRQVVQQFTAGLQKPSNQ